jgi:hypothetical protein
MVFFRRKSGSNAPPDASSSPRGGRLDRGAIPTIVFFIESASEVGRGGAEELDRGASDVRRGGVEELDRVGSEVGRGGAEELDRSASDAARGALDDPERDGPGRGGTEGGAESRWRDDPGVEDGVAGKGEPQLVHSSSPVFVANPHRGHQFMERHYFSDVQNAIGYSRRGAQMTLSRPTEARAGRASREARRIWEWPNGGRIE